MLAQEFSNPVIVLLPDGSIRLYHEPLLQVADVLRGFPRHSLTSLNQLTATGSAAAPTTAATGAYAVNGYHTSGPLVSSPPTDTSAGLIFPAFPAPKPPGKSADPAALPREQFLQPGGTYALFRAAPLSRAASATFAETSSRSSRFEWIAEARRNPEHPQAAAFLGRGAAAINDPMMNKATRHHDPPDVAETARDSGWEADEDVMRAISPTAAAGCFAPLASRKPAAAAAAAPADSQRGSGDEARGLGATASNHVWLTAASRLFRASSMPSGGDSIPFGVGVSLAAPPATRSPPPSLLTGEAAPAAGGCGSHSERAASNLSRSPSGTNAPATSTSTVVSSTESSSSFSSSSSLRRTRSSVGHVTADDDPVAAPAGPAASLASAAPLISPRGLISASSRKLVRALTALPRPRLARSCDVRAAADRGVATFLAACDDSSAGGRSSGDGGGREGGGGRFRDGGGSGGSFLEGSGPWSLVDFLSPKENPAGAGGNARQRGFRVDGPSDSRRGDDLCSFQSATTTTTTTSSITAHAASAGSGTTKGHGHGHGERGRKEAVAESAGSGDGAGAAFTSDWASQMAEFIGASSAPGAPGAAGAAAAPGAAVSGGSSETARDHALTTDRVHRPSGGDSWSGGGGGGGGDRNGNGIGNGLLVGRRAFSGLLLPAVVSSGTLEEATRGGDGDTPAAVATSAGTTGGGVSPGGMTRSRSSVSESWGNRSEGGSSSSSGGGSFGSGGGFSGGGVRGSKASFRSSSMRSSSTNGSSSSGGGSSSGSGSGLQSEPQRLAQFKSLRLQVSRPSGAAVMGERGGGLDVGPRTTGARSAGGGWARGTASASERHRDCSVSAGRSTGRAGGLQAGSFSAGNSGGGGMFGAGERGAVGSCDGGSAGEGARRAVAAREGAGMREGMSDCMRDGSAAADGPIIAAQKPFVMSLTSPGHGSTWVMDWFSPRVLSAPSTPLPLLPRSAAVTTPSSVLPRAIPSGASRTPPPAPPVRMVSAPSSKSPRKSPRVLPVSPVSTPQAAPGSLHNRGLPNPLDSDSTETRSAATSLVFTRPVHVTEELNTLYS
ncbi:hypothetical protein CLOM_g6159 [Closterium sp. NIES-68]|nr:hypothetical protein CLOM_g6159 [Closterium sp. NIES-68]GJP63169.1 hypothetical protein CLOP_g20238 [Closterium sp. NIES-67]